MPEDQIAHIRGQLDLILWRLAQIELDHVEQERYRRHVFAAVFIALLTATLGLVLPMLGGRL